MARILVTREDGAVFWNEGVRAADFTTEHFRRHLADRLGWAVEDAEFSCAEPATVVSIEHLRDASQPATAAA